MIEHTEPQNVENEIENNTPRTDKKHKPLWKRLLKIFAWIAGSLVGLLVLVMCLIAWILTPERLTPLVEKYGSEYLLADVKVKRVELTVWSSFPDIRLDVTDLQLNSRTLKGVPDSVLTLAGNHPEHLLDASSVSGSVNPWKLLGGTISLGDINVEGLYLNLVNCNDKANNYMILPPSKEGKKEDSEPWKIVFGDINITAPGGIRYCDLASGVDACLTNASLSIKPRDAECKQLATDLNGRLTVKMDGEAYLSRWPFQCAGPVNWNLNTLDFNLPDFAINLAIFSGHLNTALSLGDTPALKHCSFSLNPLSFNTLVTCLPQELLAEYPIINQIDTDMSISLTADVKCPWRFDSAALPDVTVALQVPDCHFSLNDENANQLLSLDNIAMQGTFFYNGADMAASTLDVPVLSLKGKGVDLDMELAVKELFADNPLITFSSKGNLDLTELSPLIPYSGSRLQGEVQADAELTCRLQDMIDLKYENMDANGSLLIRNLVCELPALATTVYSHLANFTFGTSLDDMGPRVPGTLLAHAEIDTLHYTGAGMNIGISDARLRAGASNSLLREKRSDNEITPMGMLFTAGRFKMDSEADTTKVYAKALRADGSITRYNGNEESPLMKANLSADGLLYSDPTMRLGMKEFSSNINAHLRERKHKGNRPKHAQQQSTYVMTPDVDEGVKSLFKTWGINGNLASNKLRVTHLMYPVPVDISGLDFDFSLDSIRLHSAYIRTQDNALTLSGTISNIRQLMLGRTRKPLTVRMSADIDNLDINQVAYNFMLGSALETQKGRLARLSPEEQDAIVRAAAAIDTVESLASDSLPLLLPRNIDARVRLRADKALYGDINLYDMRADLAVNDGAASIDSLMASTDFGNAYLNLLYSSRNPQLLNLAVDLGFSEIDLHKFFTTFPTVTAMAPAMTDLNGVVGAKLVGSFDMFPNMDIDFNSMNAVLNISGRNLTVEQSPLIRKVARMMLIRKKGPLEITDMNIQLALHDNILRLYPFKFGMEKYRFALLGQNDFSSNMYYHLSVLKSPIPFKFGINVKGTFDKPKLRFGGAKYKENEAQEMEDLIENQRVNFVKAMRLELRKLVNKAAVSYADRPEFDKYGLDKEMSASGSNDDEADDSNFSSPMDMLGEALKTPAIKALGNSGEAMRQFKEKYHIGEEADKDKKKKDKKKKK